MLFVSILNALSPDLILKQDIHNRLNSGPKNYRHITVDVENGIITLHGKVRTEADKEKIENAIRKMQNVRDINSQIIVRERKSDKSPTASFSQDSYSTAEDQELNKAIRSRIGSYWFWDRYEGLSLNTSNGMVTLDGVIDSVADEQDLVKMVQSVDGVKSVRSNLEVQSK